VRRASSSKIANKDGVEHGLVCVFSVLEPCRYFSMVWKNGKTFIRPAKRQCLFLPKPEVLCLVLLLIAGAAIKERLSSLLLPVRRSTQFGRHLRRCEPRRKLSQAKEMFSEIANPGITRG